MHPAQEPKPLVSVILPALRPEALERACDGLFYDTDWPEERLDLIVTDQGLSRTAPDLWNRLNRHPQARMISVGNPDNIAATFDQGARVCGGDVVVFMDGVEPAAADWLSALVGLAMRPDVGAVVAKVIDPTRHGEHAGLELDSLAQRVPEGPSPDDEGDPGQLALTRALSVVTGKCMALRREVIEEVRGLDKSLAPGLNGPDLCLRLQDLGYRTVWCPQALLRWTMVSDGC